MAWLGEAVLTALPASQGCATIDQVVTATGLTRRQVSNAMAVLSNRGMVVRARLGCYRRTPSGDNAIGAAALKSGPNAPHGKRNGPSDTLRSRAWRALRTLKKATLPELIELAGKGDELDPETNLRRYLKTLALFGVVHRLARREPGLALTSNGFHRWALLTDLGPKAPVYNVKTRVLFDPNSDREIAAVAP
jgi:hypothetical protein